MAPGNDLMQRCLAREQTMFETRNHALNAAIEASAPERHVEEFAAASGQTRRRECNFGSVTNYP